MGGSGETADTDGKTINTAAVRTGNETGSTSFFFSEMHPTSSSAEFRDPKPMEVAIDASISISIENSDVTTCFEWPSAEMVSPSLSAENCTVEPTSAWQESFGSPGQLCVVCGDRGSGFHYNAYTCEGCKGFFRRSIIKQAAYLCKYGGNCEMDTWMRRKCPACRLRRCLEVGMKQECLLLVERCKAKKSTHKSGFERLSENAKGSSLSASSDPEVDLVSPLEQLENSVKELIEQLVTYQELFEVPSESDLFSFTDIKDSASSNSSSDESSSVMYQHMTEMTILTIYLVVEFAKRLPGFSGISKDSQIVLLKGSASEVMMLRTARRYNPELDEVIFGDGNSVTRESLCLGGLPRDYVDDMFDFSSHMSQLGVDNAEYALLTAICIFSDRPGLVSLDEVDACRDLYSNALVAYNRHRRPNDRRFLAHLLMMLVDLRTLSYRHGEVLRKMKIERGQLPPLLSEYFDLFE